MSGFRFPPRRGENQPRRGMNPPRREKNPPRRGKIPPRREKIPPTSLHSFHDFLIPIRISMMSSELSIDSGEVSLNSQARIAPVHTLLNVLRFLSKMTYSGGVRFALSASAW